MVVGGTSRGMYPGVREEVGKPCGKELSCVVGVKRSDSPLSNKAANEARNFRRYSGASDLERMA
eukprot:6212866-Pleurochrysis_carterae.AAC.3